MPVHPSLCLLQVVCCGVIGQAEVQRREPLKALVAGGAGFIGSHLCAALLERGDTVLCVDNLATSPRGNVEVLQRHDRFSFLEHDVCEPLDETIEADLVFHLASPASVPDYLARPLETLRVNSQGTWRLIDLARRQGARFLFASTSEIYGDPEVHPQTETYWGNVNSIGPRACYDESKRFGEALLTSAVRAQGLDGRLVRIFNTYGPHSRPGDGRVMPNFIMAALRREPITIYGTGMQTRSFCYVSDMVAGLMAAMLETNTSGEVFNLGNPHEITMLGLAGIVAEHLGSDAGVVFHPLPVDDPMKRKPDISKAQRCLGWSPRIELDEGVAQTAKWFQRLIGVPSSVA